MSRYWAWLIIGYIFFSVTVAQAQTTCPTLNNSAPQFTATGQVFGAIAPQWNAYFQAKVDANNGILCNPTISGNITVNTLTVAGQLFATNGGVLAGLSITGLPSPVNSSDAATKNYVDTVLTSGIAYHTPANLATTTALPANTYNNGASGIGATLTGNAFGALMVDSTSATTGLRILVKNESNEVNNGVYSVTTPGSPSTDYVLTRVTDFDATATMLTNSYFFVSGGATQLGTAWAMNTPNPVNPGTSDITFVQVLTGELYTSGPGLQLIGPQFSISPFTIPANQFITGFASGAFTAAQPNFTNLTGSASSAQIATALLSPPPIGTTTPNTIDASNMVAGTPPATWFSTYIGYGPGTVNAISSIGSVAFEGASRSSDSPGPGAESAGGNFFGVNDYTGSPLRTEWGGYEECRRYTGTGICLGIENDITNLGSDTQESFNPYAAVVGPFTFNQWLMSGGGCSVSNPCYTPQGNVTSTYPATGAINIGNNGGIYLAGIVIDCGALGYNNCGASPTAASAIELSQSNQIVWYAYNSGSPGIGAQIRSDVNTTADAMSLVFGNNLLAIENSTGTFETYFDNLGNLNFFTNGSIKFNNLPTGTPNTSACFTSTGELISNAGTCGSSSVSAACPNIAQYGGIANGTTDNTAAMSAALSAQSAGHVCVSFGEGVYYFASTVNYTFPSGAGAITLTGAGKEVTQLKFPSATNGIVLHISNPAQNFHVRDMTIETMGAYNSGTGQPAAATGFYADDTGAFAEGPASDITSVEFRGADQFAGADCWLIDFDTTYHSVVDFINDDFIGCGVGPSNNTGAGNGIVLGGGAQYGIIYNISNSNFSYHTNGIYYGGNIQGVSISQSNFTPDSNGVFTATGEVGIDQLSISTSQFGITVYDVQDDAGMGNITFTGNVIGGPASAAAIYSANAFYCAITGNAFNGFGSPYVTPVAVQITAGSTCIISGNTFQDFSTAAIELGSGTTDFTVQANSYTSNAINVASASSTNRITGNQPAYVNISNIANNGSGMARVTVGSTAQVTSGEAMLVSPLTGILTIPSVTPVNVIDGTHLDLTAIAYTGSSQAISGGLTWLP
jgi:hypothetical protein